MADHPRNVKPNVTMCLCVQNLEEWSNISRQELANFSQYIKIEAADAAIY